MVLNACVDKCIYDRLKKHLTEIEICTKKIDNLVGQMSCLLWSAASTASMKSAKATYKAYVAN